MLVASTALSSWVERGGRAESIEVSAMVRRVFGEHKIPLRRKRKKKPRGHRGGVSALRYVVRMPSVGMDSSNVG